jgi:hypothetical protein
MFERQELRIPWRRLESFVDCNETMYLDTVLAIAAFMAGLSLVITALRQAVSGVLGLRGLNPKWGLEKLVRTRAGAPIQIPAPPAASGRFSGLKKLPFACTRS